MISDRLRRIVKKYKQYQQFEKRVLSFLSWYQVPLTWTKKDLETYYYSIHTRGLKQEGICNQ